MAHSDLETFGILPGSAQPLGRGIDEYLSSRSVHRGDISVDDQGYLNGPQKYKVRTFTLRSRGDKLFMLADDCANTLDDWSEHHFLRPDCLASVEENEDLITQGILRSDQRFLIIKIVDARSVFRHYGHQVVEDSRGIRDENREDATEVTENPSNIKPDSASLVNKDSIPSLDSERLEQEADMMNIQDAYSDLNEPGLLQAGSLAELQYHHEQNRQANQTNHDGLPIPMSSLPLHMRGWGLQENRQANKQIGWDEIRPVLKYLYVDLNMTLSDIMQKIHQDHGFRATKQVYKRKMKAWGLSKHKARKKGETIPTLFQPDTNSSEPFKQSEIAEVGPGDSELELNSSRFKHDNGTLYPTPPPVNLDDVNTNFDTTEAEIDGPASFEDPDSVVATDSINEPPESVQSIPVRKAILHDLAAELQGQSPYPDCGRTFEDLEEHMMTHDPTRAGKCPIIGCVYNKKGFARIHDRNRHTLTHYVGTISCGFCPGSMVFNRVDVFKRHLTNVHEAKWELTSSRKASPGESKVETSRHRQVAIGGKCSICAVIFSVQAFYEHLDDCVLKAIEQQNPAEVAYSEATSDDNHDWIGRKSNPGVIQPSLERGKDREEVVSQSSPKELLEYVTHSHRDDHFDLNAAHIDAAYEDTSCIAGRQEVLEHSLDSQNTGYDASSIPNEQARDGEEQNTQQELFACPFTKYDSRKYHRAGSEFHGTCASGFYDVSQVVGHLRIAHRWTDLFCVRCSQWFPPLFFKVHRASNSCLLTMAVSGGESTTKQHKQTEENKPLPQAVTQWYEIYKVLFPHQKLPESPFCIKEPASSYQTSPGNYRHHEPRRVLPTLESDQNKLEPETHSDHVVAPPSLAGVGTFSNTGTGFEALGQADIIGVEPSGHIQQHIVEHESSQVFAPTDSGYASMHQTKQAHTDISADTTWETRTAYSTASVETTKRDGIIHKFAGRLFNDMGGSKFDEAEATALSSKLPTFFADFALRLGQRWSNLEVSETMVFIHRYRNALTQSLETLIRASPEEEEDDEELSSEQRSIGDEMSMEDKMWMWQSNLEHQQQNEPHLESSVELAIDEDTQLEETNGVEEFEKYAEYVTEDCSYAWLLGKLRNQAQLTDDKVMSHIRHEVLHALPKTTNLRSRCAPVFPAVFEVLWPLRFYLNNSFADGDQVHIGQIITITGSSCDAQALTCGQYMEQTWPGTGIHLIQLLQQIMKSDSLAKDCRQRPDGAVLEAWEVDASTVCVKVIGTSGVAAEIAEQLSWLSAALRGSSDSRKLMMSMPSIHCMSTPKDQHLPDHDNDHQNEQHHRTRNDCDFLEKGRLQPVLGEPYRFQVKIELRDAGLVQAQGLCWNQMFGQSTMVHGFPIRRRQQKGLGLEISLKVAAELVGTKYVNSFAGNLFVKGYSALLVPTLLVGDVLVWHLSVHSSGQHLPYQDQDAISTQNIKIEDISKFRHVVGWCSNALNYVGAADGHYTVRRARLSRAYEGCALVDDIISFCIPLTDDIPFVLSKQHYTSYARRSGYSNWFRYLSQKFVLLWDKRDQKGWLVNGISALLHLVRASLSVDEKISAGSEYFLRPSDLKEPGQPHSAKAPREFLSQRDNLRAKISLKKIGIESTPDKPDHSHDEYEILNDRMEQYCHVLEKAMKYSEKLRTLSARNNKGKSAFRLEGWDFVDLAEKVESVDACTTTLSIESHAWLELIRSIGVATFFGQGFGELIRPSATSCCQGWQTLPAGKHYIAANVADIKRIMELRGNPDSKPRYLTETMLWHHPATAFGNCGCKESGGKNVRLVQQPCSTQKVCVCPALYHPDLEIDDHEGGAVIFGYNPEYGPLPEVQNEDDFEDSGLGSSLVGTMSQSGSSTQPTQTDPTVRQYGDGNVSGGNAHFGDHVQYIYNNYGVPLHATQQSALLNPQLGPSYQITEGQVGTKRSHSEVEIATRFSKLQSADTNADDDPGPSKRAKTTTGSRTSWKDIMLA